MNRKPVPFPTAAFEEEAAPTPYPLAEQQTDMQPDMQAGMQQNATPMPGRNPAAGGGRRLDYEGLRQELNELLRQGKLPAGFDLAAAVQDHAFLRLLLELPAYAAVRVYVAEQKAAQAEQTAMQQILSRLQARQGLPRSSRADAASASRDYMNMSPEEFARLEREYRDKARKGIKVKL